MACVVAQKGFEPPSAEAVVRALQPLGLLTEAELLRLSSAPYGLLVRNLSLRDAVQIEAALEREGVPSEAFPTSELPGWPEARPIQRLEGENGALRVFDSLGRLEPVEWSKVAVVAAGGVVLEQAGKGAAQKQQFMTYAEASNPFQRLSDSRRGWGAQELRHVLEIILAGGTARFRIDAESFFPDRPGNGLARAVTEDLAELVRLLARQAPGALLNRGATALYNLPSFSVPYPTAEAFDAESIWLLWRRSRANGHGLTRTEPRPAPRLRIRPAGRTAAVPA